MNWRVQPLQRFCQGFGCVPAAEPLNISECLIRHVYILPVRERLIDSIAGTHQADKNRRLKFPKPALVSTKRNHDCADVCCSSHVQRNWHLDDPRNETKTADRCVRKGDIWRLFVASTTVHTVALL